MAHQTDTRQQTNVHYNQMQKCATKTFIIGTSGCDYSSISKEDAKNM